MVYYGTTLLEIKNTVVVVAFIFLKHNGLCGRLPDSNYFYTEESVLHNFIQQSLNSGPAQVQILLAACRRFEMVRISDNGPGWQEG